MVAPSAIPFIAGDPVPQAMDQHDIVATQQAFVDAAKRAVTAGFKVIEVHAAHGYLLHEFLSPLSNQRNDSYGGSLANRMRMVLETVSAVRAAIPEELPLWVRISATDWVEGGWDLAQSIALATELKKLGVDLVDCSTGAIVPDAVIPVAPGFQVPFATAIRAETGIATGAVGLITEAQQANNIIAHGEADIVLLARAVLRDPYWPLRAAEELDTRARWPKQYAPVIKQR
jgi:2,4-dienoyl-CoA reductase (NADPH2)